MDETKSEWRFLLIEGWKGHFVPEHLAAELIDDAIARGHDSFALDVPKDTAFIDLPGMVMVDRKLQTINVGDLPLEIPVSDFGTFLNHLKKLKPRVFAGGQTYRKLHGWLHCIVIPEASYTKMVLDMTTMLPAVEIMADQENKEFVRRLDEVNKDGVKVISHRDTELLKKLAPPLSGTPNNEKN